MLDGDQSLRKAEVVSGGWSWGKRLGRREEQVGEKKNLGAECESENKTEDFFIFYFIFNFKYIYIHIHARPLRCGICQNFWEGTDNHTGRSLVPLKNSGHQTVPSAAASSGMAGSAPVWFFFPVGGCKLQGMFSCTPQVVVIFNCWRYWLITFSLYYAQGYCCFFPQVNE